MVAVGVVPCEHWFRLFSKSLKEVSRDILPEFRVQGVLLDWVYEADVIELLILTALNVANTTSVRFVLNEGIEGTVTRYFSRFTLKAVRISKSGLARYILVTTQTLH